MVFLIYDVPIFFAYCSRIFLRLRFSVILSGYQANLVGFTTQSEKPASSKNNKDLLLVSAVLHPEELLGKLSEDKVVGCPKYRGSYSPGYLLAPHMYS